MAVFPGKFFSGGLYIFDLDFYESQGQSTKLDYIERPHPAWHNDSSFANITTMDTDTLQLELKRLREGH